MAAEIFDSPTKRLNQNTVTYPAGQPLIFSIQDTATTPDRFVVIVTGYYTVIGAPGGTQEAKLYLTPNAQGKAYFDLSKIAEGVLKPGLVQRGGGPGYTFAGESIHSVGYVDSAQGPTCRRYKIEVAQYNNGTEGSVDDSETIYVINGTEQPTSGLFPDFTDYAGSYSIGWLTDTPSVPSTSSLSPAGANVIRRKLAKNEDQCIGWLFAYDMGYPLPGSVWGYTATARTSTGNVGTQFFDFATFSGGSGYFNNNLTGERVLYWGLGYYSLRSQLVLDLGPSGLNLIPDPENINEVLLQWYDGTSYSGLGVHVTWDDEEVCKNGFTQLAYTNTRGGWDYLRFDSRTPMRISTEGKQYRKSIMNYQGSTFSMDGLAPQYETYAKSGRRQYTLSDLFFTVEQREQLEIAMRAKTVQIKRVTAEQTNASLYGWEPATILTNSVVIEPTGSRFFNVSIDVEVAQDIRC